MATLKTRFAERLFITPGTNTVPQTCSFSDKSSVVFFLYLHQYILCVCVWWESDLGRARVCVVWMCCVYVFVYVFVCDVRVTWVVRVYVLCVMGGWLGSCACMCLCVMGGWLGLCMCMCCVWWEGDLGRARVCVCVWWEGDLGCARVCGVCDVRVTWVVRVYVLCVMGGWLGLCMCMCCVWWEGDLGCARVCVVCMCCVHVLCVCVCVLWSSLILLSKYQKYTLSSLCPQHWAVFVTHWAVFVTHWAVLVPELLQLSLPKVCMVHVLCLYVLYFYDCFYILPTKTCPQEDSRPRCDAMLSLTMFFFLCSEEIIDRTQA